VPEHHAPVLWLGQAAVATLPMEIDIANSDQVREDLLTVLNRGPTVLVVDMAGTTFCDSAGVNALVRAHKRAAASGVRMRLVVSAPTVQRVLAITGVDRLIGTYPTVAAALIAADQPTEDGPSHPGAEVGLPHPGYAAAQTDPEGWAAQPS
jgi:anti-sigma B factor antagonist